MRILHIINQEKFIDAAFEWFEYVKPGANECVLIHPSYRPSPERKHIQTAYKAVSSIGMFSPRFVKSLKSYDLVVLHSMPAGVLSVLVCLAPANVRFIWLGWGYDYYDLITDNSSDLLLEQTSRLENYLTSSTRTLRSRAVGTVKQPLKSLTHWLKNNIAVKRISVFAPVLHDEYVLIKDRGKLAYLPRYLPWRYGVIGKTMAQGVYERDESKSYILLGNSASATNNHLEALELLSANRESIEGRKVVVPLSYGNEAYGRAIIEHGYEALGSDFIPMTEFLPIEEYAQTLMSCSHVIMNHKRQQALFNIFLLAYAGAVIFLRDENPVYKFLVDMGIYVYSMRELEENPLLLTQHLSNQEKSVNQRLVAEHVSPVAMKDRTMKLIEGALLQEDIIW